VEGKRVIRTLITLGLAAALVTIIVVSQKFDPTNPHATVDKNVWLNGPNGHGYAVKNNQQPWKQCYPCHVKKGLGGEEFCQGCHTKSGLNVAIPQQK